MLPVVEALAPHVRVSIDTRRAGVAEPAVAAGATLVNDVSASLERVAAEAGRGLGGHAHAGRAPDDAAGARSTTTWWPRCGPSWSSGRSGPGTAGVDEVWIDPGIGFGKTAAHNLALLRRAAVAGRHRLAGAGRHQPQVVPRAADGRAGGRPSRPTTGWRRRWPPRCGPLDQGAAMVRVHDVAADRAGACGWWRSGGA